MESELAFGEIRKAEWKYHKERSKEPHRADESTNLDKWKSFLDAASVSYLLCYEI